ncbi:hypothetical protein BTA51_26480 [Hahella sp. CCB-MM4]|uniref:hypothetical protein n=1 Tax=Hahella sp. (strain CCB-MM4) TaxID=1926491 RepID=UPI000B9B09CD|nr:hypothetical protein [Hahella sp. CCB-MM4]OZG70389.1 hypothetical protein BTA51_26480 [Hahella sp. CCB-MM4]
MSVRTVWAGNSEVVLYTNTNGMFSYSTRGNEWEHRAEYVTGTAVQMVKDIFQAASVNYELKLRNLTVGLERAKAKANTGYLAASKDAELSNDYLWIGPIARDYWAFYAKRDSDVRVDSLNDLRGLKIGGHRNSPVTKFLQEKGIAVRTEKEDYVNPYRLNYDLIDIWATTRGSSFKLAFESGYPEIMEVYRLDSYIELYLALNKNTDKKVVRKLTDAYHEMILHGRRWY